MFHSVLDSGFGYLVEGDSVLVLKIEIEQGRKVPRYRFSLAIRVGCEDNFIAFFNIFFQLADELLFSFYNGVFGAKSCLTSTLSFAAGRSRT